MPPSAWRTSQSHQLLNSHKLVERMWKTPHCPSQFLLKKKKFKNFLEQHLLQRPHPGFSLHQAPVLPSPVQAFRERDGWKIFQIWFERITMENYHLKTIRKGLISYHFLFSLMCWGWMNSVSCSLLMQGNLKRNLVCILVQLLPSSGEWIATAGHAPLAAQSLPLLQFN